MNKVKAASVNDLKRILYLPRFLPYRLTKLSGTVSRDLAAQYSATFDLTIPEWRIVALLGSRPGLTAREIAPLASLDKVSISRAVERLVTSKRLKKRTLDGDRRSAALYLTEAGMTCLRKIIPIAQQYEDQLLEGFTPEEIEQLDGFLNRLDAKAEALKKGD
ncbi:MarR family transcriptional regulator [uncultured Sneathiella sp.]|jgi:DNA-binding MarR family transcriptional regulator|uniref:MarR family winged helix-turn-helix transcriptional regulator n=1 Tax=uncultured Sneathiella sp. TaxID=879315 RepID=UPI0030DDBD99|tara:strand:- start:35284 stop:35769 length:486 start_codon:yes stop_codon:yes gene_type:complete